MALARLGVLVKPKKTEPTITVGELRDELKLESDVRFPWPADATVSLEEVLAWLQGFQETGGVAAIGRGSSPRA